MAIKRTCKNCYFSRMILKVLGQCTYGTDDPELVWWNHSCSLHETKEEFNAKDHDEYLRIKESNNYV